MNLKNEKKFRVWDKINRRMIVHEQDFIPLKVTNLGVLRLSPHHEEMLYEFVLPADKSSWDISEYIGQKDKNGKEIYEGDIIKHVSGTIAEVYWDETPMAFVFRDPATHGIIMIYTDELKNCEIIGNIFENKEMLMDNKNDG